MPHGFQEGKDLGEKIAGFGRPDPELESMPRTGNQNQAVPDPGLGQSFSHFLGLPGRNPGVVQPMNQQHGRGVACDLMDRRGGASLAQVLARVLAQK